MFHIRCPFYDIIWNQLFIHISYSSLMYIYILDIFYVWQNCVCTLSDQYCKRVKQIKVILITNFRKGYVDDYYSAQKRCILLKYDLRHRRNIMQLSEVHGSKIRKMSLNFLSVDICVWNYREIIKINYCYDKHKIFDNLQ